MTINITDCENVKIDVIESEQRLKFSATANSDKYEFDLVVFEPIVQAESAWNTKGRNILINLAKKDGTQEEWWPRITKEKIRNESITIDWARWCDPDEEEEKHADAGGDFDPAQYQNMMGGGGMGGPGMEDPYVEGQGDESDDEEGVEAQVVTAENGTKFEEVKTSEGASQSTAADDSKPGEKRMTAKERVE